MRSYAEFYCVPNTIISNFKVFTSRRVERVRAIRAPLKQMNLKLTCGKGLQTLKPTTRVEKLPLDAVHLPGGGPSRKLRILTTGALRSSAFIDAWTGIVGI